MRRVPFKRVEVLTGWPSRSKPVAVLRPTTVLLIDAALRADELKRHVHR